MVHNGNQSARAGMTACARWWAMATNAKREDCSSVAANAVPVAMAAGALGGVHAVVQLSRRAGSITPTAAKHISK